MPRNPDHSIPPPACPPPTGPTAGSQPQAGVAPCPGAAPHPDSGTGSHAKRPDPLATSRTGPAMAALRAATRADHEALHHHPLLAPLAAGTLDAATYAVVLDRFLAFHRAIEGRILAPAAAELRSLGVARTSRLPLLEADLADLAAAGVPLPPDSTQPPPPLPQAPDLPEILGVLYVVEGSRLGGVGLAAALARAPDPRLAAASRFLGSTDRSIGPLWHGLGRLIDAQGRSPHTRQRMIRAALAAFAAFTAWLDTAAPPLSGPPPVETPPNRGD